MQLRWWGHTVFAVGTVAVAAATVLLLAVLRPETDTVTMVLAAAVVILAGGLAHEIAARRASQTWQTERLARLRQGYEELVDLFLHHHSESAQGGPVSAPVPAPPPVPAPTHAAPGRAGPGPVPSPLPAPAGSSGRAGSEDAEMSAMVWDALAEQRVEVHLQPIVSLSQRKHRFYEALSRIRLPDGRLLLPEHYLAAAEYARLLPAIDVLLLNRIAQLVRETDRRQHTIGFFANVSPVTLLDASFTTQFLRGLDHQMLHGKLMFEIDQHDLVAGVPAVTAVLDDLKRQGYRFSMGQVEQVPVDPEPLIAREIHFIKLDATFLTDPGSRSQVTALQTHLNGRPIELIAEKIETEHQLACAIGMGIAYGQGFLIGEPRPSRRMP